MEAIFELNTELGKALSRRVDLLLLATVIIALIAFKLEQVSKKHYWSRMLIGLLSETPRLVVTFLVALLFNGKPMQPVFFGNRDGNFVDFPEINLDNIQWYNAMPIAIAPLLILYPIHELIIWMQRALNEGLVSFALGFLVTLFLIRSAAPSMANLEVMMSYPRGLFLYLCATGLWLWFLVNPADFLGV